MDALQAYHSSDSEDESEAQSELHPPPTKRKLTETTPALPKPDLDFTVQRPDVQGRSVGRAALSHSLLPWSRRPAREESLTLRRTNKYDAQKVGVGGRSVRNDSGRTVPNDQLVSGRSNTNAKCQGTLSGSDRQRPPLLVSQDHRVVHPRPFGPELSSHGDEERGLVVRASSVGSSSESRDGTPLPTSRSSVSETGTKRPVAIQPYVSRRSRHQASDNGPSAHQAGAPGSVEPPPSRAMYTPSPVILHQMGRSPAPRLPGHRTLDLRPHAGPVTRVRWCAGAGAGAAAGGSLSHLLLSASMDRTLRVWSGIGGREGGRCLQTLDCHRGGVKDAQWAEGGRSVLSCSFDKTARLSDVESGKELQVFDHPSYATCIKTKPDDPSLFICGTYTSSILCWDLRTGNTEHEYKGRMGQILDLEFLPGSEEFASSCDVVSRDSADRTVMVWDLRSTAVLSNQLYHEKHTCPCLRAHPSDSVFVAQSTANYIAIFSAVRPYKLNKFKRYEGHQLEGHHIGCDFSPDGAYLVSGSSEGKAYFYDYRTSRTLRALQCFQGPCTDVACHPVLPGVIAACSWDGNIQVWQ